MLAAYLDRLGVARPAVLDGAALAALHRAHLVAVPFENLSLHLGERVDLAEGALLDKVVTRRRGGFCYELNGAFGVLLEALGAQVGRVGARVRRRDGDGFGPPMDHLALVVTTADGGGPWLADVGFGASFVHPLRFDVRDEQDDPAGRFLLRDVEDGDVELLQDGVAQYRIETHRRTLDDAAPACWWHATSPSSSFLRSPVCSRVTAEGGRVSLSGTTVVRTSPGGVRSEETLDGDATVLAAYRELFGIVLDRLPVVPVDPVETAGPA